MGWGSRPSPRSSLRPSGSGRGCCPLVLILVLPFLPQADLGQLTSAGRLGLPSVAMDQDYERRLLRQIVVQNENTMPCVSSWRPAPAGTGLAPRRAWGGDCGEPLAPPARGRGAGWGRGTATPGSPLLGLPAPFLLLEPAGTVSFQTPLPVGPHSGLRRGMVGGCSQFPEREARGPVCQTCGLA